MRLDSRLSIKKCECKKTVLVLRCDQADVYEVGSRVSKPFVGNCQGSDPCHEVVGDEEKGGDDA